MPNAPRVVESHVYDGVVTRNCADTSHNSEDLFEHAENTLLASMQHLVEASLSAHPTSRPQHANATISFSRNRSQHEEASFSFSRNHS